MSNQKTAHIRRIDQLGRISVPKDVREALDLHAEDALRITLSGSQIVMEKARDACVFCSSEADLIPFGEKFVCSSCRDKLKEL